MQLGLRQRASRSAQRNVRETGIPNVSLAALAALTGVGNGNVPSADALLLQVHVQHGELKGIAVRLLKGSNRNIGDLLRTVIVLGLQLPEGRGGRRKHWEICSSHLSSALCETIQ